MTKVLVVDDSPDVLLLCKVHLEYEGYAVVTAEDGHEALAAIAREHPDLVILDIMMPGMDGWEVLATIRETWDIPVVMLTARGEGLDEIRGWREGAAGYVTKPFNPAALSVTVRKALRRSPGEADLVRSEMLGKLEFDRRLTKGATPEVREEA
jgi:two-component system alkaline phosphatase synthesis response regulator PhoP